jgi:hypothetical protein
MAHLALFLDREAVSDVRIIECMTCTWFVDYYCYSNPEQHSFGTEGDAWREVSIHARAARHGLPRIIRGSRP